MTLTSKRQKTCDLTQQRREKQKTRSDLKTEKEEKKQILLEKTETRLVVT